MNDTVKMATLVAGVLIVILLWAGTIAGSYWLKHRWAYSWSYEEMVKETVREIIREEYSVICEPTEEERVNYVKF